MFSFSSINLCGFDHKKIPHTRLRRTKRKSDRPKSRRAKKPNFGTEVSLPARPEGAEVPLSVLEQLRKDKQLRRIHNISNEEIEMLSRLITFGCELARINSLRDLIFILNTIRHAGR